MNQKETLEIEKLIQHGCALLKIVATPEMIAKSAKYIALILKWNRVYNLTAARTGTEIAIRHFLDSLSIAPYITRKNILDFGSGAGFPGIPLAIFLPDYNFTLLESRNKRARFLYQTTLELKLTNVKVVAKRSENFLTDEHFDIIVTRATSGLNDIINNIGHLCGKNTLILAMVGKTVETIHVETIHELSLQRLTHEIQVPMLNEKRHLVEFKFDNK